MKYSKFTAPALLAIAATGIAAAPAFAEPAPAPSVSAPAAPAPGVRGVDHGVNYTTALADAGKSVVTTVTGGAFTLDTDKATATLRNADGAVVASVPLTASLGNQQVPIAAAVSADGTQLTLTPTAGESKLKDISSQEWFMAELQRASTGGITGALIGAFIGVFGLIVGIVPGAIVGGVIGLLVAGGQPLIDSGSAYFSGQP
ncbi:hypothetical protein [Nocardia camponoti]|uniref:DUF8020 domain-containing protein n=1 Tax=Nocardia camponoti TaxID=1616106 RepID=A0A917Q9B7_9NOCA|nr:hypothetical protein [Nocardia camponoti]GGK37257.1 hypothetical protein GCM10011591_06120 [Nocardia camponoti]